MTAVTYEVIALDEAKERGLPYWTAWEHVRDGDIDWGWGVWRCEDGAAVEFIGEDGGEPEDQVLVRDWRWVAPALQEAFDLGVRSGGPS